LKDYAYCTTTFTGSVVAAIDNVAQDGYFLALNDNILNGAFSIDKSAHAIVFNALGQIVTSKILRTSSFGIDCSMLSKGVYFLKIVTDEESFTRKFSLR
jgi:hypothetical protein